MNYLSLTDELNPGTEYAFEYSPDSFIDRIFYSNPNIKDMLSAALSAYGYFSVENKGILGNGIIIHITPTTLGGTVNSWDQNFRYQLAQYSGGRTWGFVGAYEYKSFIQTVKEGASNAVDTATTPIKYMGYAAAVIGAYLLYKELKGGKK